MPVPQGPSSDRLKISSSGFRNDTKLVNPPTTSSYMFFDWIEFRLGVEAVSELKPRARIPVEK
jgi:hypothetical protein